MSMYKQKNQIFFIHGGDTFPTHKSYVRMLKTRSIDINKKIGWNGPYLDRMLGKKFHIIRPRMPLQDNAKYNEWKIHFERYIPKLKNGVILIGQSLGGAFLAKYLSENKFLKKILATYLVCPPFDDTLPHERLVGGFGLKSDLLMLQKNSPRLNLLFSRNDDVVPLSQAKKFAKALPWAKTVIYPHIPGHFRITKFPEIVRMIMKDAKTLK